MKIAVVILNWNGVELLKKFLPSVVENSAAADIYVADNASTDGSVQFLANHYPGVKIIQNPVNYGFAQGYNEALHYVDADVYALVNSDVEVTENWLQPIVHAFGANPDIAIIQPKILDFKRKNHFEYAGAAGGFIDKYGYPFCRGRIFESIEQDEKQYDDDIDIFWASGACMFIRSDVFKRLDGFDADFFAHQEEIDLCWRAFNCGLRTRYIAGSTVYHVGGATLNAAHPRKTYLNFRNSLLMLHKNLPSSHLYKVLIIRLLLDGAAGLRFLAQGKPRHLAAVVKAHFAFYKRFRANALKRMSPQKTNYYKVNNIIISHFLRRISKYSNLF